MKRPKDNAQSVRGWHPGMLETRVADLAPSSYDKDSRTVDAVLSMGSPVKRFYGTEVLRIHPDSVDLARLKRGGIPLLDSHMQNGISSSLGRVQNAWFKNNALMGRIAFHETPEGQKAEGMVARGEINSVSAGYRVEEWEIADEKGNVIDPEVDRLRWDDNLTFTATRWELLEASLVAVPADSAAVIRNLGAGDRPLIFPSVFQNALGEVRERMRIRQAMLDRLASRKNR